MTQLARPPRQYAADGLRPQTLLFTFLGHYVKDRTGRIPIGTATFLALLERLGVSNHAARTTLARMVQRGFLDRTRTGRRAWFAMTDRLEALLEEGAGRLLTPPVRELDPDVWTLLSFSIPEDQRDDRHTLRSALGWAGFGPFRNGLWIAPGEVDVADVVGLLELDANVDVFAATARPPTDVRAIVRQTWDLEAIAAGYHDFLARWQGSDLDGLSPLALQVRLLTEWRQLLVDDPQLAAEHLPSDWPSLDAFAIFRRLLAGAQEQAETELLEILELQPRA